MIQRAFIPIIGDPSLNLDFTSSQVLVISTVVITFLLVLVTLIRRYVNHNSYRDLTSKYSNKKWRSPIDSRTKYPDVEVAGFRPIALLVGFVVSLSFVLLLLNWTTYSQEESFAEYTGPVEMEIEVTPPQTAEPPPPPPPPPPPVVQEIPEDISVEIEESLEFLDQSIEAESMVDAPPEPEHAEPIAPPPPPPPPPKEDVEEIFKVVEEMPRFPGCEDMSTKEEKKLCSDKALYQFVNSNLHYPAAAAENNIQGNVVVQFVVNRDGTVQDISVLRDIGAGCGEEVVRVVDKMNKDGLKWIPGKQRGRPVRVMFVLPVKFTLMGSK